MQTIISQVVQRRTAHSDLFTALDISRDVQREAKQQNMSFVRHNHLKNDIHNTMASFMGSGAYTRTLCDIGVDVPVFVYHPVTRVVSDYPAYKGMPVPMSVPTNTSSNWADDDDDNDLGSSDSRDDISSNLRNDRNVTKGRFADLRGTLTVPASLVSQIGIQAFDQVAVYSDTRNNESIVVVTPQAPTSKPTLTTYTVDKDRNVRVTQAQLAHIGLGSPGDQYDFDTDGSQILISKHN